MNDADGPRTEPGRIGRLYLALLRRGTPDLAVPPSIVRDAGTVAATAIAERPVAWTLIAGGLALYMWERARTWPIVCPSAWIVGAVFIAAVACAAVVRERRGLPVMLAVLAAFAAVVGNGRDSSTPAGVAGTGAVAAMLLLHGSVRALRLAGGLALAFGCLFALWGQEWRIGQGGLAGTGGLVGYRLGVVRQEVLIAAGIAMLAPVVRPRVAASVVIGAALVAAIGYIAAFDRPVTNAVHALVTCSAVGWFGATARVSCATSAERGRAPGTLAARVQRGAWIAAFLGGCVVVADVQWTSALHCIVYELKGLDEWWGIGATMLTWVPAVKGVAAGCLGALAARMRPPGAGSRCIAAYAAASLVVAAGAWLWPVRGNLAGESLRNAIIASAWAAPSFLLGAVLATSAPGWRTRKTAVCAVAAALLLVVTHAALLHRTGAWLSRLPVPRQAIECFGAAGWGAVAVLAAAMRAPPVTVAASFAAFAVVMELSSKGALALAPDWDIPFAPQWTLVGTTVAYSLCWIFILRPLCARTPVPDQHPTHRDFDALSRET